MAEASALELVLQLVGPFDARIMSKGPTSARVIVVVQMPSGDTKEFNLRFEERSGTEVRVLENEPRQLPASCPDRHINIDGAFCLYAAEVEPLAVSTESEAREWWETLKAFLQHQIVAGSIGRWVGPSLAHGEAASYQVAAERLAKGLGAGVVADLTSYRLSVRTKARHGKKWVQLLRDSDVIAETEDRIGARVPKHTPCICDRGAESPHAVSHCGRARLILTDLIHALLAQRRSEMRFARMMREGGHHCCMTLEACSIRAKAS